MWVISIFAFFVFAVVAIVLVVLSTWLIHKVNNTIARDNKKLAIEFEVMEDNFVGKRNKKKEE